MLEDIQNLIRLSDPNAGAAASSLPREYEVRAAGSSFVAYTDMLDINVICSCTGNPNDIPVFSSESSLCACKRGPMRDGNSTRGKEFNSHKSGRMLAFALMSAPLESTGDQAKEI